MKLKNVRNLFIIRLPLIIFISLICLSFSGCATFTTNNNGSGFSGKFSCPGYKGENTEWEASEDISEHKIVNGVNVIVVDHQGKLSEKTGPYTKTVMIADGKWRYLPLYRNKKIYPVKIKTEFNDNKLIWQAEYPEFIDNKGKKRLAKSGKGMVWIDQNGDRMSTGSHYTGQIKCKRLINNTSKISSLNH